MRISLGYQVLIAIFAGLFCGLFFGPLCKGIEPIGHTYIMLLQMVVLPYICFSLIHGLGSINPEIGKKLFFKGWFFWVALWGLIFAVIYLVNAILPKPLNSFVGSINTNDHSSLTKNFLNYIVPENPIYDLANNIVPAIAIFSIIVGVALMHLEKKDPLLALLDRSNQIIEKIFKWLAILSPIGVFAHIAVASGTVRIEDLSTLGFYVASFIVITLFITFWILPAILTALTPLRFKEVLSAFKFVCLLPFATALPTIALPFITIYMKQLGEKHAGGDPQFHSTAQTVMPICYSFGQIGNCLIFFFILFLSFFYRHPFSEMEKLLLSLLAVPLSLGSSVGSTNAVSFLTQLLQFPQETNSLFSQTTAITLNFQVLLSMASVLTLIILVLYSYYGLLKFDGKKLLQQLIPAFAVFIAFVIVAKYTVHLRDNYQDLYPELKIAAVIPHPVAAQVLSFDDFGVVRPQNYPDALETILKSGILKVGFNPNNIPYCYFNNKNELVGSDIAYAYELARDLDCTLQFLPIDPSKIGSDLSTGRIDIAMSAVSMRVEQMETMGFTHPYTEQDNVLVIPEENSSQFKNLEEVQANSSLRVGTIGGYEAYIHRILPLAQVVATGQNMEDAFETHTIDAYVWSRSSAIIWSLSHPGYIVMDYGDLLGKTYFAYPIAIGSFDWRSFLNNWLLIKTQSGFKEKMHRYWIDGERPTEDKPRWSILGLFLQTNRVQSSSVE